MHQTYPVSGNSAEMKGAWPRSCQITPIDKNSVILTKLRTAFLSKGGFFRW